MTSAASLTVLLGMAVPSYLFGAIWYMALGTQWMAALGKTAADIRARTAWGPSWAPFPISFLCQLVMAWVFASLRGHMSGAPLTVGGGMMAGGLLWLGFVASTLLTNHAFQSTSPRLTLIDGGHWLGVLLIQGAMLAWLAG